jgi:hypothetical protein
MGVRTDLDVDAPWRVEDVLREAAQDYYESAGEVSAQWGEDAAGKVWADIADILESAADRIHNKLQRAGLDR